MLPHRDLKRLQERRTVAGPLRRRRVDPRQALQQAPGRDMRGLVTSLRVTGIRVLGVQRIPELLLPDTVVPAMAPEAMQGRGIIRRAIWATG